ncbi:MAG: AEC family transporter [Planctomycetota bacterium]
METDVSPLLIVSSVLGVFLVMVLGAVARGRHWLTQQADVSLAKITTNILLPSLFLDRLLSDATLQSLADTWQPPVFGFVSTAIGFLLAFLFAKSFGPLLGIRDGVTHRAFALSAGICNYGYIPLPLAQSFYPTAEVDLLLHNVGVDLALWTVGISLITRPAAGADAVQSGQDSTRSATNLLLRAARFLGSLVSPPFIAVSLALLLRTLGWNDRIPLSIMKPIGWMADSAIPMGLLLSGAIIIDFLKQADWKGSRGIVVMGLLFRQGFMPMLMLVSAACLPLSIDLQHVVVLEAAMPAAVFPIVLVRMHEGDVSTALRVVLSTSLMGIVLIPVWIAVGLWWLGL